VGGSLKAEGFGDGFFSWNKKQKEREPLEPLLMSLSMVNGRILPLDFPPQKAYHGFDGSILRVRMTW
jgi:hypothetical protein